MFYRAVVEDNNDPLGAGRVRVRIFGLHTENNENSTEIFEVVKSSELPWAEIMGGTEFGLVSGIGTSSVLKQGTWVWCALNHDDPNKPIIVGTIIGIQNVRADYASGKGFNDKDGIFPLSARNSESDINRLARNSDLNLQYYDTPKAYGQQETIHKIINDNLDVVVKTDTFSGASVSQSEPASLNNLSTYPNVQVTETASGHVIETDDTPSNERVRVYHKSGSYIEVRPDGSFVQKSNGATNHYICAGDVEEHIKLGVKRYIEQNLEEIINGEVKRAIGANLTEHISGNVSLKVDGNLNWDVTGTVSITSGGNYAVTAPRIDMN